MADTRAMKRLALVASFAWLCAAANTPASAQAPDTCPPIAQAPTAEQLQAGARGARDRGFLWRISKGGRDSWLFGTLHVARFEWVFPGPKLLAALRAVDTVALELDPTDAAIQQRLADGFKKTPHTATLPAALQQRLDAVAQEECVPPAALSALPPELQAAGLGTLIGRRDGIDPAYGIDGVLAGWARGAKLAVVSLESPELQLEALRSPSAAEGQALVESTLEGIENGSARAMVLRIGRVWAEGDWPALASYRDWCDCLKTAADRDFVERVLDDRNPGLADGIDALHRSGQRVFAAVGSLHMVGPTGLPALLAARGYRVEKIAYDLAPPETTP
jgi:uncharacterized protein